MDAGEVTQRMVAAYKAGELVTTCAWCGRVTFDGEWVRVPHAALLAIDPHTTLSHSICPECAARYAPRLAEMLEADPGMSGLLRIVQVSELPDEPV